MGKPSGFMEIPRELPTRRPVSQRINDFLEVYNPFPEGKLREQGARCMDCGIPFCHQACPLGNLIPDWNDLIYHDQWKAAIDRLHATNNFPEFTGKLCPAPCEASCVLAYNNDPVTIKQIEAGIVERAWNEGWVVPRPAPVKSGKKVGIAGSGPAGLACAQQLARAGHSVIVFEHADRIGGLLRYGIPDFKLEKWALDRRLRQMEAEGVQFKPNVNIGVDLPAAELLDEFDAICLCGGATRPRDLPIEGRGLAGVAFAMDYLTRQNRQVAGDPVDPDGFLSAHDKHVVIIGGGDTGADCLGTVHRQGCKTVTQFEIVPQPPDRRAPANPWPQWSNVLRLSAAHEEGGERKYSINTKRFLGTDGRVQALATIDVEMKADNGRTQFIEIPGTGRTFPADLVLLAMGFVGPERGGMLDQLGVELDQSGNVKADANRQTSVPKVFTAGDMNSGPEPDRLGDRRGKTRRRRDRSLPDGLIRPSPAARTWE